MSGGSVASDWLRAAHSRFAWPNMIARAEPGPALAEVETVFADPADEPPAESPEPEPELLEPDPGPEPPEPEPPEPEPL